MTSIIGATITSVVLLVWFTFILVKGKKCMEYPPKTTYSRVFYVVSVTALLVANIGNWFDENPTVLGVGMALMLVGCVMGVIILVAREKYRVEL